MAQLETEIKLRLPSASAALARIAEAGFRPITPRLLERNQLFDTESDDLRRAGCMLRLRHIGPNVLLTSKGPARRGRHKTRAEAETRVENWSSAAAILQMLGYRPTFRYEKFRTAFGTADGKGHLFLDETPIGVFLEVEGEPEWIDQTASRLGFAESDYLTASYGGLYLEYCRKNHISPSNMVFPLLEEEAST